MSLTEDALDEGQFRALQAMRSGTTNVLLFGKGGSGKTAVANLAFQGKLGIKSAVATTVARRFGGEDGLNTQELLSVLRQHGMPKPHRYVVSNPTCQKIFGFNGALNRGDPFFIAIDEAGQVSGEHLYHLVDALWRACSTQPNPRMRFSRISWVLLGDPERQLPNITGTELLKSAIFDAHPSGFSTRIWCGQLSGGHRFRRECREYVNHIEWAFQRYDRAFLDTIVKQAKARYREYEAADRIFWMQHFVATRLEAETYLAKAAAHIFGSAAFTLTARPPDTLSEKDARSSEYTSASYIFSGDPSVLTVIETTVSGKNLVATSCDNPEITVPVANRTEFTIDRNAITDFPDEYPHRQSSCTVSVHIAGVGDCTIPMFHFNRDGGSQPIFRQIGWRNDDNRTITAVRLLFNAQGFQYNGVKIVIGSEKCNAPITGTFAYVALTRSDNPHNVLFSPNLKVEFSSADEKRRAETRRLIAKFTEGFRQKSQAQAAPPPKRRRLSCNLPTAKPSSST